MSRCNIDLWPVDLESSWYIKRHVIKVCTKFDRNRAIGGWIIDDFAIFSTLVALWLWPLDLELLRHFDCHAFKLCKIWAKSNNARLSYWRFSTFTPCSCRGLGTTDRAFSVVRGSNFTELGEDIGRSSQHVSEFGYLAAFLNVGGSKLSDAENWAKFRTLLNPGEN